MRYFFFSRRLNDIKGELQVVNYPRNYTIGQMVDQYDAEGTFDVWCFRCSGAQLVSYLSSMPLTNCDRTFLKKSIIAI